MKTLTKVLTTLTLSLTVAGMANASTLIAKDQSLTTELCMTAASGNRAKMHNTIKNSGYSKSYIYYNVKCNDQNITEFVAQHGNSPKQMNSMLSQGRTKGRVSINDIASL